MFFLATYILFFRRLHRLVIVSCPYSGSPLQHLMALKTFPIFMKLLNCFSLSLLPF